MRENTEPMKHVLRFFTVFCMFLVMVIPAYAQKCKAEKEVIVNFDVPGLGSYSLWDATFGDKEWPEEFVSGFLAQDGGGVIVGGHRFGHNKNNMTFVVSELDRRGRKNWTQEHKIKGVDRILKLLPVGDGFWAIGTQRTVVKKKTVQQVWIGMFDGKGQLLGEKVIGEAGSDVIPSDIIASHDGNGFLVSATLPQHGSDQAQGSRVYFLNSKGAVVDKKSFLFGSENIIRKMAAMKDGKYALVGRIRDTHNRWAGWIMVLNKSGGLEWQREYSRGSAATLDFVTEQKSGDIVVSGIARPAIKDSDRAGWVMSVNLDRGDVVWQRYYIGKSDYVGRTLIAHPNGLISVLLGVAHKDEDSSAPEELENDARNYAHARLLTLSPRGQIFTENTYFNGVSADPYDMFIGKNEERVIIGRSKVGYTTPESEGTPNPITLYSQNMWAVAAIQPDPYTDPCESFVSFLP